MYLKFVGYSKDLGEENPIKQSDYAKWMEPWKKYDPILYKFEEMIKLPGFPHENATQRKEPFAPGLRRMIEQALPKHLYSLAEESN